jgi:histidinol dehydrogenase
MAYGTEIIPKVQKVIGPGNKWVNAAKQILSDIIAIDSPAGPSEILIIADESANYEFVIVDFLSQIEHDPDNVGIIVTPSSELIKNVLDNIDMYLQNSERREIINVALQNSLIIKANNIDDCVKVSNIIAPEHIEILVKNPRTIISNIKNAGAVFIGPYSPVPIGDYSAGTNHILPTGGGAKKYSGLNVYDFLKTINILECNNVGLRTLSESAIRIAEFEGLIAHKKSIEKRIKNKD